ncbi:hypothetical protein LBMAG42_13750 [Deltaproteobacteria bacterium]|nr:hypothetical protein LBMAG42_13750 [Deltaproteobacteria bacterium]
MPASTPAQRWALGLAAVLTELNKGFHHELGGWGAGDHTVGWCRGVLSKSWGVTDRESFDSALRYLWHVGHRTECLQVLANLPANPAEDDHKQAIAREHRTDLEGRGLLAWDLGRFVAVVGWGCWAGYIPESEAWRYLHGAATWAQRRYRSWEDYGRQYELGRIWWSGEEDPRMEPILTKLLTDPQSPWITTPWGWPLGAAPPAPTPRRIKRTQCRGCGAPKQLPPLTGWVYCDHCGALTDWDFRTACSTPGSALPGPAYEAVLAAMRPKIEAARTKRDVAAMREAQIQVFTAWAEACPASLPPRAKQADYREKYVRYMAEAAVFSELDAEWRAAGADIAKLTTGIRFVGNPTKPKVAAEPFWKLTEAVERQVQRGQALHAEHGVVGMHPDGIPAELQSQLTWSVYAQGWVPMLDDANAQKLLDRTGLAGDYDTLPDIATRMHHCGSCKAELQTVPGAKCVVCEACGTRVDVGHDDVSCLQCAFTFAFPMDVARGKCPACDTVVSRV